jgi:hypothetical protein
VRNTECVVDSGSLLFSFSASDVPECVIYREQELVSGPIARKARQQPAGNSGPLVNLPITDRRTQSVHADRIHARPS